MSETGDEKALRRERRRCVRELASLEGLIRGTVLTRTTVCSRPRCACHQGRRHGPITVVAVTAAGRQRQHYVPQGQAAAVRRGVAQYHRLLDLLDRITALNLRLMREGRLDGDSGRGPS